ncbi:MAG: trimeric intracellular cation channel family protein [Alphaproteobacteria bacterium]|nr:trimeric intracellular cation channel family protein [Alphaproteobacteria bacterium]
MLDSIAQFLDWFGLCVFALTGALVASRKQMDIVGFALLGSVTGIGGGTIRDLLMGALPVFWVQKPAYLLTCVLVSCAAFFVAHLVQSRQRLLIWADAVGLALFSVTGADIAQAHGAGSVIAIALGVATATFGGIIRDILGGDVPVILRREIYVTAALLGSSVFALCLHLGLAKNPSLAAGFMAALALRAAAISFDLSLPIFVNSGGNNNP